MNNCLFCKIRDGEIPATKVFEDDQCIAFRDIAPKAPTHVLIIPRKHVSSLLDIQPEDRELVGHLHTTAARLAREFQLADGFRTVINNGPGAGQSVFHLHVHLLGGRALTWPPG